MTTKNLTKTETATIAPRLTVSRRMADQWTEIAGRLAELAALITAARPAAGTYRDAASWERDRAAMDKRLEIVSQLERRFASEAARIAEAT
jgi:hypothetical protein